MLVPQKSVEPILGEMLSDSCFELRAALEQEHALCDAFSLVTDFIEEVQKYSGAPFEYPKPVTERLIELARAYLASPDAEQRGDNESCDRRIIRPKPST